MERALGIALPDEALLAATGRALLQLAPPPAGVGARKAAQGAGTPEVAAAQGAPDTADTLLDALDWHLERHPDRVHVFLYGPDDRAEPIPYQGLAQGAARVASRLRREGIARGDTVALMLPTGQEYFFGFVGILAAGGIPVPIYPPARLDQIEEHLHRHARILDNARTAYLITVPQGRTVARKCACAQVGSLRAVLTLEELERETPIEAPARPGPRDIAMLQYTSGSTGEPKGVVLTHANLLANIRAMGTARGDAADTARELAPLYHDMGLIGAWLVSSCGRPSSLSPATFMGRPARWLWAIDDTGTLSAAPNFAYDLCATKLDDVDLEGLDLSSWRVAFNGAEPVNRETLERFAARLAPYGFRGEALAPVYGLAESWGGRPSPRGAWAPSWTAWTARASRDSGEAALRRGGEASAGRFFVSSVPPNGGRGAGGPTRAVRSTRAEGGASAVPGPFATRGYYRNAAATGALSTAAGSTPEISAIGGASCT